MRADRRPVPNGYTRPDLDAAVIPGRSQLPVEHAMGKLNTSAIETRRAIAAGRSGSTETIRQTSGARRSGPAAQGKTGTVKGSDVSTSRSSRVSQVEDGPRRAHHECRSLDPARSARLCRRERPVAKVASPCRLRRLLRHDKRWVLGAAGKGGRGGRIRTCKSLRTEGFKPSTVASFVTPPSGPPALVYDDPARNAMREGRGLSGFELPGTPGPGPPPANGRGKDGTHRSARQTRRVSSSRRAASFHPKSWQGVSSSSTRRGGEANTRVNGAGGGAGARRVLPTAGRAAPRLRRSRAGRNRWGGGGERIRTAE